MNAQEIITLFSDKEVKKTVIKNTSHGELDFRVAILVEFTDGEKIVIKLADNSFTDEAHLEMWKKTAEIYRSHGYYCPQFIRSKDGEFPYIEYEGHTCIAYGEEYAKYRSADTFDAHDISENGIYTWVKDALQMNAKIAKAQYDYTTLPSAYALFELFDETDEVDEVLDNAREWKKLADQLPAEYADQVGRIWTRWTDNRAALDEIYPQLPTSVFQADLNPTNILLDEDGRFQGVYDFNIAGRDVFLNYLFREVPYICYTDESEDDESVLNAIRYALRITGEIYPFSGLEKKIVLPLYRCLKPLWWTSIQRLKEASDEPEKIRKVLDDIERMQTEEINFWE